MKDVDGNINFIFTKEQQEIVAKYYDGDASQLEDYELCELLDKLISYSEK